MPRTCTVCNHSQRKAINRALVDGAAIRDIAARFQLSSSAIERHKSEHLPATMLRAKEARESAEGSTLLTQLQEIGRETLSVLDAARSFADQPKPGRCAECVAGPQMALKAIARLERQIELHGRLAGELGETAGTAARSVDALEWLALREAIVRALAPYPDARQAVADALEELGA